MKKTQNKTKPNKTKANKIKQKHFKFEHGEVYVLTDGGEGDLDLGNYERFLDCTLNTEHNITTGKIYQSVIDKERKGDYLGKTVQVVPHITDEIQEWIERVAHIPTGEIEKERGERMCVFV